MYIPKEKYVDVDLSDGTQIGVTMQEVVGDFTGNISSVEYANKQLGFFSSDDSLLQVIVNSATNQLMIDSVNIFDINPTVSIEGWMFGEPANSPIVEGNTGNGEVTIRMQ